MTIYMKICMIYIWFYEDICDGTYCYVITKIIKSIKYSYIIKVCRLRGLHAKEIDSDSQILLMCGEHARNCHL
jgi:hypothetical protein